MRKWEFAVWGGSGRGALQQSASARSLRFLRFFRPWLRLSNDKAVIRSTVRRARGSTRRGARGGLRVCLSSRLRLLLPFSTRTTAYASHTHPPPHPHPHPTPNVTPQPLRLALLPSLRIPSARMLIRVLPRTTRTLATSPCLPSSRHPPSLPVLLLLRSLRSFATLSTPRPPAIDIRPTRAPRPLALFHHSITTTAAPAPATTSTPITTPPQPPTMSSSSKSKVAIIGE